MAHESACVILSRSPKCGPVAGSRVIMVSDISHTHKDMPDTELWQLPTLATLKLQRALQELQSVE